MSNGSAQPGIISGVVGHVLLYSGLLVAGMLSLLGSGASGDMPMWALLCSIGALGLSLIAGLAGLLSSMQAHNLARRIEKKAETPPRATDKQIDSARRWSLHFSAASFWVAGFATLLAIAVAIGFFFSRVDVKKSEDVLDGISITSIDGSKSLKIEGPVSRVSIDEGEKRCAVSIETPKLKIETTAPDCAVP
jgi:hypothetical protein